MTPFASREPLPASMIRDRLPPGIASAWVFVLRASHRNPAHQHPNSTQHTAVIRGSGTGIFGTREIALRTFDVAHPDETIHSIPPGTAHAFATGADGLVVLSFHTVAPEELVEIEVETARSRTYVADEGGR
jgi:quercetin dioxygenase-like cupin family protein